MRNVVAILARCPVRQHLELVSRCSEKAAVSYGTGSAPQTHSPSRYGTALICDLDHSLAREQPNTRTVWSPRLLHVRLPPVVNFCLLPWRIRSRFLPSWDASSGARCQHGVRALLLATGRCGWPRLVTQCEAYGPRVGRRPRAPYLLEPLKRGTHALVRNGGSRIRRSEVLHQCGTSLTHRRAPRPDRVPAMTEKKRHLRTDTRR